MSAPRPALRTDRFCAPAPARPPRGQNPAVPAYFSHRSGPARGGKPARAALRCVRRRQGKNHRISGGFAHSPPRRPGASIHINRLQKNGKHSWDVHCNFSQSSPFCSIINHRHSRGPGRACAPDGGVGRTFSGQIVPFVHRFPFPIPGFPFAGNARHPPPGRRRADASFVSFVRPLHAERLRPQAPPGVQHHIGKGECL